jgi:hypothetical protein
MNTTQEECDHGWTTPPECPQCIAQERDELKNKCSIKDEHVVEVKKQHDYVLVQNRQLRAEVERLKAENFTLTEKLCRLAQPEKQIRCWVDNAKALQVDNNKFRAENALLRDAVTAARMAYCAITGYKLTNKLHHESVMEKARVACDKALAALKKAGIEV